MSSDRCNRLKEGFGGSYVVVTTEENDEVKGVLLSLEDEQLFRLALSEEGVGQPPKDVVVIYRGSDEQGDNVSVLMFESIRSVDVSVPKG